MPKTLAEHDVSSILPTPTHCTPEPIPRQITFTAQSSRNKRLHGVQGIEPQSFGRGYGLPGLEALPHHSPTSRNRGFSISPAAFTGARRGASIRWASAVWCRSGCGRGRGGGRSFLAMRRTRLTVGRRSYRSRGHGRRGSGDLLDLMPKALDTSKRLMGHVSGEEEETFLRNVFQADTDWAPAAAPSRASSSNRRCGRTWSRKWRAQVTDPETPHQGTRAPAARACPGRRRSPRTARGPWPGRWPDPRAGSGV